MFLAGMLMLSFGAASAQPESEPEKMSELSFYGKVAFNGLDYQLTGEATRNNRLGAGLGIQYAHYLNKNWSISAGLEYQQYRSEAILSNFSDYYGTTDTEEADFNFRSSADTYKEWQGVDMVNIPLLLQYETSSLWATASIYASVGFQLGIPVFSKYKSTAYGLKTSGYYPQWDALLENPSFMGFGSWGTVKSSKQKLDIRNSNSLLLEIGFKQQLNAKQDLYFGFYADLGLNNLNKNSKTSSALIEYEAGNPTNFQFNSVLNSSPQAQGETYGKKLKNQEFGLKIRYAFKL